MVYTETFAKHNVRYRTDTKLTENEMKGEIAMSFNREDEYLPVNRKQRTDKNQSQPGKQQNRKNDTESKQRQNRQNDREF